MLFSFTYSLTAIVLFCHLSPSNAGHLRMDRKLLRMHRHLDHANPKLNHAHQPAEIRRVDLDRYNSQKRDGAGVAVTVSGLQKLHDETDAFSQWMTRWFASANATNTASSIVQVRNEVEAHEVRMKNWLDAASFNDVSSKAIEKAVPTVSVTSSDIQQLQNELIAFSSWMTAWFASANATDSATSVALLQEEIQAYEGWIKAWFDVALFSSASKLPPLPTTVPTPTVLSSTIMPVATSYTGTATTLVKLPVTTSTVVSEPASSSSSAALSSLPPLSILISSESSSLSSRISSSPPSSPAVTSQSEAPGEFFQLPSPSTVQPSITTSTVSPPSSVTSFGTSSAHSSAFNAQASDNVAVYFGASDYTGLVPLDEVCQDSNVNIIVLAFLNHFFDAGGYPAVNFGAACGGSTPAMEHAGASGLLSCPDLASKISTCQSQGKKVLLSLGGGATDVTSTFSSDQQATEFAAMLWNLFGGGTGVDIGLRPFGSVKLDGFDIDNESHNPTSYITFTSALRSHFPSDPSKPYYISAAPQCPQPDASIPLDAMKTMDFVWVQFYNNGNCNIDQPGFFDSFKAWSTSLGPRPKLYVGALAKKVHGTGYLNVGAMQAVVRQVRQLGEGVGVGNLGGVMLWDGSLAVGNGNYQDGVKSALRGG
ncbi:hypothetical protein MMC24_005379 [Lignoscripta atroalba]|nr:hypothetical protein [Lignoscripta atroalba]